MTGFDPLDLSSTPAGAPLVPLLPIRLRRTEILTVVYRTESGAARALVPRPLELASDLCVLHVYHMHDAEWFGDYCESAWQLSVILPDGTPAVYSPFLVLESDGAVAAGREAYGQPKKAGQVSLESRGDLLIRQEEEGVISRELVTRLFTDVTEHEAWTGPATLELRPNAQVPAYLLAVREVVLGLHRMIDLTLAPGHIIYRYPAGGHD